jgi:hypothetical protein
MRRRDVVALAGVVAGAAGVITLGFLLKKFLSSKRVEKFEEELVERIIENSPIHGITAGKKRSKRSAKVQGSRLVKQKRDSAAKLLASMKRGQSYTQVELVDKSGIPYRSVRRYVELLAKEGKLRSMGYGKGKKFTK